MSLLAVALQLLVVSLTAVALALLGRGVLPERAEPAWRRRRLLAAFGTALFGAALFVPAWLIEGWIERWAGLSEHARALFGPTALVYALLVAAPIEQGLKVLAVVPAWRARTPATPREGAFFGAAAAFGFISAHNLALSFTHAAALLDVARALVSAAAHVLCAAAWGLALGRDARRTGFGRFGGRTFNVTWLVATLVNGVHDHLVFGRGVPSLLAASSLVVVAGGVAFGMWRRSSAKLAPLSRPHRLHIAPPTLAAVRAALWRTEQPVMMGWIGLGALVNVGVITAALAAAVAVGRRFGLDFAAVDRGDGSAAAVAPLLLLGAAALGAFPVSGYLVARASSSHSVLESAIAAALAVAGALVLLGLAAPVAVVFVIAFAPVALALACVGAWVGITK